MKATEPCFLVVLFIILHKEVLIFKTVNEIVDCDHSYKSYQAVLCSGFLFRLELERFREKGFINL